MGHLARVGARRRPAQPSFELVYSLSVCQLFRLSRFVPDFDVSGKTAEPKMAFNFAHLLSAACGGAPHRLRRLRRPWRRAVRAPLCGFRGGLGSRKSRFVPDFDVSGKTAEPKMAFNFAHLLSAACGGAPRRLGRLRRPPGRVAAVCDGYAALRVRPVAVHNRRSMACSGGARLRSRGFHTRESGFYIYENIGRP